MFTSVAPNIIISVVLYRGRNVVADMRASVLYHRSPRTHNFLFNQSSRHRWWWKRKECRLWSWQGSSRTNNMHLQTRRKKNDGSNAYNYKTVQFLFFSFTSISNKQNKKLAHWHSRRLIDARRHNGSVKKIRNREKRRNCES